MKSIAEYYITCDIIGCDRSENYFAGEETKISKSGWAFVYPDQSKDEFDCWTLCPRHARLASIFTGSASPIM
jgi:hypothetical protein